MNLSYCLCFRTIYYLQLRDSNDMLNGVWLICIISDTCTFGHSYLAIPVQYLVSYTHRVYSDHMYNEHSPYNFKIAIINCICWQGRPVWACIYNVFYNGLSRFVLLSQHLLFIFHNTSTTHTIRVTVNSIHPIKTRRSSLVSAVLAQEWLQEQ